MDKKMEKEIVFFGRNTKIICDGKCNKAWGLNKRPYLKLSKDPDDTVYLADNELGEAPEDPGTYEGADGKPTLYLNKNEIMEPKYMNKWCARECERSHFEGNEEKDFSKRVYNISKKSEN